jgi:predicted nucleic acid-binding protein
LPRYFPDTNILIDFGRKPAVRERLERAQHNGATFVIVPPVLIELTRGMVRAAQTHFNSDKQVFTWLRDQQFDVLPLPFPFAINLLAAKPKQRSGVVPDHYKQLIQMVASAADFADLLKQAADTVWRDVNQADAIHDAELDKEIQALCSLAKKGLGQDFTKNLSRSFGLSSSESDALVIAERFSAALEFLESSIAKIRSGANPRRNDPGVYGDFQLLFYLADADLRFLTKEDFRSEIKKSIQRDRIVGTESLP